MSHEEGGVDGATSGRNNSIIKARRRNNFGNTEDGEMGDMDGGGGDCDENMGDVRRERRIANLDNHEFDANPDDEDTTNLPEDFTGLESDEEFGGVNINVRVG
jgi:hypothetical protein